jgi:hypothetical protein
MTINPNETPKQCAQRVSQYLNLKQKDVQMKLQSAETIGEKRDILISATKPEHNLMVLFTSPSPYAVEVVDALVEMALPETDAIKEPSLPKTPPKSEKVYDDKGKFLYTRTPKREFNDQEKTFLKQALRRGVATKDVFEQFNSLFQQRTYSSVSTKLSRLRAEPAGITGFIRKLFGSKKGEEDAQGFAGRFNRNSFSSKEK